MEQKHGGVGQLAYRKIGKHLGKAGALSMSEGRT